MRSTLFTEKRKSAALSNSMPLRCLLHLRNRIFILLTLAAVVTPPVALTYIPLPGVTALIVRTGRWPILFALVPLALAVLYRYGPSRTEPRWRWITWGSVSAAVVWLTASALFSWYVASFGSYNKTYGSLGAIIGFMTWIWISIIVVLVGAKLNAEMEHQISRDSTTRASKAARETRGQNGRYSRSGTGVTRIVRH